MTYAQHLSFEGIPIDGSIENFQAKLASKGIKRDAIASRELPKGQRVFTGKFKGYNSTMTVYYNRKTRLVYKVKSVIDLERENARDALFDKHVRLYRQNNSAKETFIETGAYDEAYKYTIYQNSAKTKELGYVYLEPSWTLHYPSDYTDAFDPRRWTTYTIIYVFVDKTNTDLLTPSTTEPISSREYVCGKEDKLYEYTIAANKYKKDGLYGTYKMYLEKILDWFKYDCYPEEIKDYEENIESEIYYCDKCYLGSDDVHDFYTDGTSSICYGMGQGSTKAEWHYYIKFDMTDINQQINCLKQVRQQYVARKRQIMASWPGSYKTETTNAKFDATLGRNKVMDPAEGIAWKREKVSVQFETDEHNGEKRFFIKLFIGEGNHSYTDIHVMTFFNEQELDQYIDLLSNVRF